MPCVLCCLGRIFLLADLCCGVLKWRENAKRCVVFWSGQEEGKVQERVGAEGLRRGREKRGKRSAIGVCCYS